LKAQCPFCQAAYTIKPEFLGKKTVCKNCGQTFTLLDISKPPAPVAALEPCASGEEADEIHPVPEPIAGRALGWPARIQAWKARLLAAAASPPGDWPRLALALTLAAVAGGLVGAGLMGLARQGEMDELKTAADQARSELTAHNQRGSKVKALQKERERLRNEIGQVEAETAAYPPGSIPRALAGAAVTEYRLADALLVQQIAALESGAKLVVSARATGPNPRLAAALEGEMTALRAELEVRRQQAAGLPEDPRSATQTAIATQEINLAILNRNRLIAKYGLSSPLPPPGPAAGGENR
jgi:predicted Zn finger-like uncharacterized protein